VLDKSTIVLAISAVFGDKSTENAHFAGFFARSAGTSPSFTKSYPMGTKKGGLPPPSRNKKNSN
jgi:hypothetical protein